MLFWQTRSSVRSRCWWVGGSGAALVRLCGASRSHNRLLPLSSCFVMSNGDLSSVEHAVSLPLSALLCLSFLSRAWLI
jgi:hypothetical protein